MRTHAGDIDQGATLVKAARIGVALTPQWLAEWLRVGAVGAGPRGGGAEGVRPSADVTIGPAAMNQDKGNNDARHDPAEALRLIVTAVREAHVIDGKV